MDYRKLLRHLIDELQANPGVLVGDAYLGEGLTNREMREQAGEHGLKLAEPVREFYSQIDGAIIQWRLKPEAAASIRLRGGDGANVIRGEASFYMLNEMLPEWANLRGTPFDEGLKDKGRIRRFRPFDKNVEEAFAGFVVEGKQVGPGIYYLRQGEDLAPLAAGPEEYVRALVQARAFQWWQDAFAARPGGLSDADVAFYVPQLFQGETLDAFKRR